ncbi:MAG TPA: flavodoxin [Gammaproteobacteria bacterium]|nr:flavodoxin [Gammaproteobacteria bacterium]
MKRTLVVYFSRTGYTQRVAERIALAVDADCEPIRERSPRTGVLGYWRSAREALRKSAVEIAPASANPRDYALVVLGTPVWAGNMSSPIRAYIAQHKLDFARVALFCTQGGSGGEKVLRTMADLCGTSPVATICFNDSEIDRDLHFVKLQSFTAALSERRAA